MARIRSIKPDIWEDEALGACPLGARLLFVGLITQADDEGRLRAGAKLLRSRVFPYDDSVTARKVEEWLDALVEANLIHLYLHADQSFAQLCGWSDHQKVDKPTPSRIPSPESAQPSQKPADSEKAREDSPKTRRGLAVGREGIGRDKDRSGENARDCAQRIYETWQTQSGLITHRQLLPNTEKAITKALATYDESDIVDAIGLYATILTSDRHYWTKSWTLAEFLQRGLDRFTPETRPLERFIRQVSENGGSANGHVEKAPRTEAERIDSAYANFMRMDPELADSWLVSTHKPSVCAAVRERASAVELNGAA